MYNAVAEFLRVFVNSTTATSVASVLTAKLATLITLIQNLVALAATQEQPIGGKLKKREQALGDMTEVATIVAGMVLSFARRQRRPELAAEVRRVRTEFRRLRRSERTRIAQRVHDVALPLADELVEFGLTADMLDELRAAIDTAEQAIADPVSTKAIKKVSTQELKRAFADVDQLLAEIDPILRKLRKGDPKSYDLYQAARTIFDRPGTRPSLSGPEAAASPTAGAAHPPAERKAA